MRFMAKQLWRTSASSAAHKYLFNTKRYEKEKEKLNNKKVADAK